MDETGTLNRPTLTCVVSVSEGTVTETLPDKHYCQPDQTEDSLKRERDFTRYKKV